MYALIDCNSFYASCEKLFEPALRCAPVVVLSNNDGCIIARSPEAKDLGIKMGQPAFLIEDFLAQNRVAVFSANFTLYGDISARVMDTLRGLGCPLEVYSIDEAFVGLHGLAGLEDFARTACDTVLRHTGIPTSVGIGPTKTLAKVANHLAKKCPEYGGVAILRGPEDYLPVLETFPVEDVWGIGPSYRKLLNGNGITTAARLAAQPDPWLRRHLTVVGLRLAWELRGTPCLELEEVTPKKAVCVSRSFGGMLEDIRPIRQAVATFAGSVAEKLRSQASCATSLTIFLETNPFRLDLPQRFPSRTVKLPAATSLTPEIVQTALAVLEKLYLPGFQYKKAGVMAAGFVPETEVQGGLFEPGGNAARARKNRLAATVDRINGIQGRDRLRYAAQGFDRTAWWMRQTRLSPRYTTRWGELLRV